MRTVVRSLFLALFLLSVQRLALAQDFEFHPPQSANDAAAPAAMRDLAERVLPVYQENEPERYLGNLSALQVVAGDFGPAVETRQQLQQRRRTGALGQAAVRGVIIDMYTRAKAIEQNDKVPFAQAFSQVYKDVVPKLSDAEAYALTTFLVAPVSASQDAVQRAFDQRRAKGSLTLPEALELVSTYVTFDAFRSVAPLVAALESEDDQRRYAVEQNVTIKIGRGVSLTVMFVRPKIVSQPLPALLEFAMDPAVDYAKESAAHGYVGVMAYARGIAGSKAQVTPFEHDGDDARAVIAWIIKQSWSDGRVGMYGSGYSGFAAWAATRKLPAALKAIATSDAMAPGVDFPMAGSIFHNDAFRWAYRVTNAGGKKDTSANDDAAWRALDQAWYASGSSYRDFTGPRGRSLPVFTRWLNHPSYDLYWQKMVPFGKQFAKIDIPVLTTTGYFAAGQAGALYYYQEHMRFNKQANHTLLIGPYDDSAIRHGVAANLQGLPVDAAAQINLRELRYEWFDSVFKGAKRPALLKDQVNYQVAGTNEWRHAPSLEALAKDAPRYFLDPAASKDGHHLLSTAKPAAAAGLNQTLALADRKDAGDVLPTELLSKTLRSRYATTYTSEPLSKSVELTGVMTGVLDFRVNKMDVDLNLAVYELQANGDYIKLFDPTFDFRASYARDRVHRHLLQEGVRQHVPFRAERIVGRKLQAGSRIVVILGINKLPDREINYGFGDDVSVESIDDGRVPVNVRWYGGSYIDLPGAGQ